MIMESRIMQDDRNIKATELSEEDLDIVAGGARGPSMPELPEVP
jgi:hypothetical protein